MTPALLRHKETLLIEVLLSSLDIQSTASAADSPMLVYLADLLVKRAREELEGITEMLEAKLGRVEE